ncbi:MAG: TonB-dependent receptor, partial [Chitinophagales bacterium]|nr:TonB-dependent receptor [Chitinophagales bacterium]
MKTYFSFIILFLTIYCTQLYAQTVSHAISGTVLDVKTQLPVEFAAVAVLNAADSSVITGAITDEAGKFLADELKTGNYILRVSLLGYDDLIKNIEVQTQIPLTQAGNLLLQPGSTQLGDVTITAEKSYFQNSIDKKVYNIEKDIVASGGSASDALQTIPSVTIDIEGNISLRGSDGVRIFIDGKPSGIVAGNMNAILEQIPASSIESIEVVTNPSARYEAEGSSGIINIVLKKNKQLGLNGNITAGITSAPKYESGISLNFRNNKINVYSNYSYVNDPRDNAGHSYRRTFEPDTAFYLGTENGGENKSQMHMARAGIDYYINQTNTVGLTGSYFTNFSDRNDLMYYDFLNEDSVLTSQSSRNTDTESDGSSFNIGMNYRKMFTDPKRSLTADAFYSYGDNTDLNNYNEQFFDPLDQEVGLPLLQTIARPGVNKDLSAQIDYVHPFKNGNQFEAGLKYTKEIKDNTIYSETFDEVSDGWMADLYINNQFIYNEDVLASYFIWNGSIKKFGYQVGLRAEQTYTNSELITTNEIFENNYFGLFPSAHIAYKFNEETELAASYSRRIDRPNSWFLNPFPDYSDPYSLRIGNPDLEPEYENSYEISFTKTFKKHTVNASVFYDKILNEISPFTVVDTAGVALMTFQNYNNEEKYGVEFVLKDEFYKWWNMTSSFNFNQTLVDASNLETGLTNAVFNYNIRIMSFFQVLKQTALQFTLSYSTPWTFAQGEAEPIYYADAGIKSDFFQNKLTVNITVSDIFDTRIWEGYSEGINFYSEYSRKRQTQVFGVKLTYKFGQQDNMKKRGNGGMDENYDGG